jgi:DNA-3-methyladenine glycosylase II
VTLPAPRGLTDATCRKARRHLMRADPVIAELARRFGACPLGARPSEPPLRALVRALVSQQLSVKAAETIFRRFLALFPGDGFPAPAAILAVPAERLRAVGMSRPKGRYLRDLCERVEAGRLPLERLQELPDEEVIRVLTEVKGIGQWTAEMILIFQLGRPDVLPLDDVGLLRAIQRLYRLRARPKPARVERIAAPWRPYRSVACWYLWAALDEEP